MPKYSKRGYNKKYRRKARIPRSIAVSPAPNTMLAKLRFNESGTLSLAVSDHYDYMYSANGLWDPRVAVGGAQPRGFDEWMALYDHYTVLSSKASCFFVNRNTTSQPVEVTLICSDDNVALTSAVDIHEHSRGVTKIMGHPEGNAGTCKVINKASIKNVLGRAKMTDNQDLRGSATANPTEGVFWHVCASTNTASTFDVDFNIEIEYIALFTERKQPIQS